MYKRQEVTFTASLSEDLKRRDFTINAMAYNPRTGLVDLYEGIRDLQEKTIRCVGDAKELSLIHIWERRFWQFLML